MDIIKPKSVQSLINKFCYTIGMIPTSYKTSLTYEEQILAIGNYLEETVYPAINNNAEALAELQNLFVELKEYVDNYFDELNVQTQIDNKLDEMASDGTLAEIINQEIFGEITQDISDIKGDITDIEGDIGDINQSLETDEGNIQTNTEDISEIKGNITDIEGDIGDINQAIDNLEEDLSTAEGNIETNTTSIFNINQNLKTKDFTCARSIAHRGLSCNVPENTIPAIRKAGYYGCFGIEIDIQTTLDNEIVLMHDLTVDRMTNGTGNVNGLDYTYINSLTIDNGENIDYFENLKVPKLEEALECARKYNLHAMLELKGTWSTSNMQKLLNMIKYYGMTENCSIISFNYSYIEQIRELDSLIPVALITGSSLTTELIDRAIEIGNCMISMSYDTNTEISNVTRQYMIDNNVKFGFWTVNSYTIANNLMNYNPRYFLYSW